MEFAGILPPDAPDPRDRARSRMRSLPFSPVGLVAQPTIEDHGNYGETQSGGPGGIALRSASVTYTLWRNPDDRADPVNLAGLDPITAASLEAVPPWPRPDWLIEAAQRMRYPHLTEVVRTSWCSDLDDGYGLDEHLVDHINHILMNECREELGLRMPPTQDWSWKVRRSAVNHAAGTVSLDGRELDAAEIDTDPFVYAVGARIDAHTVVTVAIERRHLPYVRLALSTLAL